MNNNGDGDMEDIGTEQRHGQTLDDNGLERMFKTPDSTDTTRLLMTPGGNDIPSILMRSNLPNNKTILALVFYYQKCVKHDYQVGKDSMLMLAAALTSKNGSRANLVSDTLIGEKHSGHREVGRGVGSKLKEWVGGSGDSK